MHYTSSFHHFCIRSRFLTNRCFSFWVLSPRIFTTLIQIYFLCQIPIFLAFLIWCSNVGRSAQIFTRLSTNLQMPRFSHGPSLGRNIWKCISPQNSFHKTFFVLWSKYLIRKSAVEKAKNHKPINHSNQLSALTQLCSTTISMNDFRILYSRVLPIIHLIHRKGIYVCKCLYNNEDNIWN